MVRALEATGTEQLTAIYNVGNKESYSFNTVVDMINKELGTDVAPTYVENPIPESVYVYDTYNNISKLQAATGWAPQIAFAEGITRVCAPYQ